MHFLKTYIDQEQAAIAALKDYPRRQAVYNDGPNLDRQPEDNERRGQRPSGLTPDPTGNQAVNEAHHSTIIRDRWEEAARFLTWFDTAWAALDQQDRDLLEAFYLSGQAPGKIAEDVAAAKNYSEHTAYRKRNLAVKRLAKALFG